MNATDERDGPQDAETGSSLRNIVARIPEPVYRRLRHAVVERHTSINRVVNTLILRWLDENAPEHPPPEGWR